MKKIPSLFKRDFENNPQLVLNEVTPGAEWVINGEGFASVKLDGTSCMVRDGKLYRRYDAKNGKTPPPGFDPCQEPDPITGHWPGWVPVGDEPNSKWHRDAFAQYDDLPNGTYELIGEKVSGNPYGIQGHELKMHGRSRFDDDPPRDFDGLREWFVLHKTEGIVWHHPSGEMVKIKRSDFGLRWPVRGELDIDEKKAELCANMSDLSEHLWCAGWMHGCEYLFYKWTREPGRVGPGIKPYLDTIKRMADEVGGWFHWPTNKDGFPVLDGPLFITCEEWRKLYDPWLADQEIVAAVESDMMELATAVEE